MADQTVRRVDGKMEAAGRRFVIVVSRWNELVTKELLDGALDELGRFGAKDVTVVRVPGTWELPVAVRALLTGTQKPDAIVALGCILMGQTQHGRLLSGDVGGALMGLQREFGVPIAWGVLTPDTQEQALDRSGVKMGNKGREAAAAAIEMASIVAQLSAS
jgi:6,7-dimethyl-8-ribityllumazine synthase